MVSRKPRIKSHWALALLMSVLVAPVFGEHYEGRETNVVLLDCEADREGRSDLIEVAAYSQNATSSHIPLISKGKPCSQVLHELLTHGFTIEKYEHAGEWDFLLLRVDEHRNEK